MSLLKILGRPIRRYFNPRFEDLANRLERVQTGLDEVNARVGDSTAEPADTPGFDDFTDLLHELRSLEMARMPRVTGTMLSAGCSGLVYFDWISRCYGQVDRHIGVELYLPEPEALPENVEWVKASVGQMEGVTDGCVDLVFSGQNFEHLFGDDAVLFLLECYRVLKPGGWLVIDSPHREVTSAVGWTMPEHTIEFTPAEVRELLHLAGFDVVDIRGLWLCRDPGTGEVLPLWPVGQSTPGGRELVQRAMGATQRPEDSFIWWSEARRSARQPDVERLRARHAEIFGVAWPERQQRLLNAVGSRHQMDGRTVVTVDEGTRGYAQFGPYMPLAPGRYAVPFQLRRRGAHAPAGKVDKIVAVLDVADVTGDVLVERQVALGELEPDQWHGIVVEFEVEALVWGGQFRVFSTGSSALDVALEVNLAEEGTVVAPTSQRQRA